VSARSNDAERAARRELGLLRRTIGARARALPLGLLAASVVYVVLRWLIVDTSFDQVALWMYETFPMGTLAELAIRRVDFPLHFYYDNAAGQILAGILTIPSFLALGPSYLALKLVPFVLGFSTLVLLYLFLRENFGRRAANIGAFLFALGPPTLVKYSVICSGNHFENLFFSLLAIACFYRLHATPESARWRFASGFTAGFALFVFLGALIPVGILCGMHLGLRGLRRAARDLPVLLAGFALGLLPLVVLNLLTEARGLGFLSAKFADESSAPSGGGVVERSIEFVRVHLPRCGVFEDFGGLSRAGFGAIFTLGFAIAYAVSIPGALRGAWDLARRVSRSRSSPAEHARAFERSKLVPFVLYLPLAALAYGLSNFRIGGHAPPVEVAGYRYFLPHILFAIVLVAVVCARAWSRGGAVRVGGAVLGASLVACGLSSFAFVDWSYAHAHLGLYYEGYDLHKIARGLLSARNDVPPEEILARIEAFPPFVRQRVTRALGFNLGVRAITRRRNAQRSSPEPESWQLDLATILAAYPEDLHAEIARGAGIALRFDAMSRHRSLDELALHLAAEIDRSSENADARAHVRALCEGACMSNPALPLESLSAHVLDSNRALIASSHGACTVGLVRGQGLLCGRLVRRGIPTDLARVRAIWRELPEDQRAPFCIGYGMGLAEEGEDPAISPAMSSLVPVPMRAKMWLGFGESIGGMYRGAAPDVAATFAAGLDGAERRALEQGLSGDVDR
jgi:hypothetical protein